MARVLIPNMEIECALRLIVACICGALIGFERTKRYKGAGIRTYDRCFGRSLVCSCFTIWFQ